MNIQSPKGAIKKSKVIGRGTGCGRGCTSGRGNKGQKSRSGYSRKIGFEGGQMPLARRVPKRGFNNKIFEKTYNVINISVLNKFNDGDTIDYAVLLKNKFVSKKCSYVKLLGNGELSKKINVIVDKASKEALKKVKESGGNVTLKIG